MPGIVNTLIYLITLRMAYAIPYHVVVVPYSGGQHVVYHARSSAEYAAPSKRIRPGCPGKESSARARKVRAHYEALLYRYFSNEDLISNRLYKLAVLYR